MRRAISFRTQSLRAELPPQLFSLAHNVTGDLRAVQSKSSILIFRLRICPAATSLLERRPRPGDQE